MPRLSVYVSDELWEQAKSESERVGTKPGNSQLVQRALEQLVNDRRARQAGFRASATRDESRLAAVVAQLRDEAGKEYEKGYAAMLEFIELENIGYEGLRIITNLVGMGADNELDAAITYAETGGYADTNEWLEKNRAYYKHEDDAYWPSEPW